MVLEAVSCTRHFGCFSMLPVLSLRWGCLSPLNVYMRMARLRELACSQTSGPAPPDPPQSGASRARGSLPPVCLIPKAVTQGPALTHAKGR